MITKLFKVKEFVLSELKWWPHPAAFQLASKDGKILKLARHILAVSSKTNWEAIDDEVFHEYDLFPVCEDELYRYYA